MHHLQRHVTMSESDDEDEIYIQYEDEEKSLSKDDANSALRVKAEFYLDHEPACVYKPGKKEKRVEFGSLEPGKKYVIKGVEKMPNQKEHL